MYERSPQKSPQLKILKSCPAELTKQPETLKFAPNVVYWVKILGRNNSRMGLLNELEGERDADAIDEHDALIDEVLARDLVVDE
jgi:hypothetical protein